MKKLFVLWGLAVLGTAASSQPINNEIQEHPKVVSCLTMEDQLIADLTADSQWNPITSDNHPDRLDLNDIVYIEEEAPLELGFNTEDYLPEGFDPCEIWIDLNAIVFVEEDELEDFDLGFDTSEYLPEGFNPYADPVDIAGFNFIEEEVDLDPDFDTEAYLPANFDAYARTAKKSFGTIAPVAGTR